MTSSDLGYHIYMIPFSPYFSQKFHCLVLHIIVHLVVSTHSIDPCLWGESDHPAFGPPARIPLHLGLATYPGVTVCRACQILLEGGISSSRIVSFADDTRLYHGIS